MHTCISILDGKLLLVWEVPHIVQYVKYAEIVVYIATCFPINGDVIIDIYIYNINESQAFYYMQSIGRTYTDICIQWNVHGIDYGSVIIYTYAHNSEHSIKQSLSFSGFGYTTIAPGLRWNCGDEKAMNLTGFTKSWSLWVRNL